MSAISASDSEIVTGKMVMSSAVRRLPLAP